MGKDHSGRHGIEGENMKYIKYESDKMERCDKKQTGEEMGWEVGYRV